MKTPDEIKKGLDVCTTFTTFDRDCENCPYDGRQMFCADRLKKDAFAYIQQLEQELAAVKRERDAAVDDLNEDRKCDICVHADCQWDDYPCSSCVHSDPVDNFYSHFEWRGVCPENTEVQEDAETR